MMWDRVIEALRTVILADPILSAIYGESVRMASASATPFVPNAPVLEYLLIADSVTELWAPVIIQFDQWNPSAEGVVDSERRLRRIFDDVLPREYAGLRMWVQYEGGEVTAMPDRNGFSGRAIRFRFTPLRERYDPE